MITKKNQSMNAAMKHISHKQSNTASYKADDGDVWEFRINFLGAVMECRDEKISKEWRPVCTIFSCIDCTDHGWTLHRQVRLMWKDMVILEDYDNEDMCETIDRIIDKLDWEGVPWRYALIRWLVRGNEESAEVREAYIAEMFDPHLNWEPGTREGIALQYFLDFLEEGGTPDDFIPFHFEEVE